MTLGNRSSFRDEIRKEHQAPGQSTQLKGPLAMSPSSTMDSHATLGQFRRGPGDSDGAQR